MFELKLVGVASDLSHKFLNDITERASVILNHNQFQHYVLDELCAQVTKSRKRDCTQLQQFVQEGCSQLKIEVNIDKFHVPDVLMQCEVFKYNGTEPCKIFISLPWYEYILKLQSEDAEYKLHVALGVIKLIHECCHCCTSVFCAFAASISNGNKTIKITPPDIGRTSKKRKTKKSTKEIGDMGYGGEQILLGGRIFPVLNNCLDNQFKMNGFRLDIHEKSSIASQKYTVDSSFTDTLFDINKLKKIDDLAELKIKLDNPFISDKQTKTIRHSRPVSSKRRRFRKANFDSSLSTSTNSSTYSNSDNLYNVDENDPYVRYPPYYIAPPGFIPRTSDITSSEDDLEDVVVNGMPSNFRQ